MNIDLLDPVQLETPPVQNLTPDLSGIEPLDIDIPQLPEFGKEPKVEESPVDRLSKAWTSETFNSAIKTATHNDPRSEAPAFSYSQAAAERYKEFGYNPLIDNEEKYAQEQSWAEGWGTRIYRSGVTALTYGTNTVKSAWNWAVHDDTFWGMDSKANVDLQNTLANLELSHPIYTSKDAAENPFALRNMWSPEGFMGSTMESVTGFGVGAMIDMGITQVAFTIGSAAVGLVAGSEVPVVGNIAGALGGGAAGFATGLVKTGKNLLRLGELVDAVTMSRNAFRAISTGKDLYTLSKESYSVIKTAATLNKAKSLASLGFRSALAARGEAALEAQQGGEEIKRVLIDEAISKGEVPDYEAIDKEVEKGKLAIYRTNLGVLGLTNALEFVPLEAMFKGSGRIMEKLPISLKRTEEGLVAASKYSGWQAAKYISTEALKQGLPEAGQEALQFAISDGAKKYYEDRASHADDAFTMLEYMFKDIPNALTTTEGLQNTLGGLVGSSIFGGSIATATHNIKKTGWGERKLGPGMKKQTQTLVDNINRHTEAISKVLNYTYQVSAASDQVKKTQQYKQFRDAIDSSVIHLGQSLQDAGKVEFYLHHLDKLADPEFSMDDFAKMTGMENENLTQADREKIIGDLKDRITRVAEIHKNVTKAFSDNPFDSTMLDSAVKIFSKDKILQKAVKERMYQKAVQFASYTMASIEFNQHRIESIKERLTSNVKGNLNVFHGSREINGVPAIPTPVSVADLFLLPNPVKEIKKAIEDTLHYKETVNPNPNVLAVDPEYIELKDALTTLDKVDNESDKMILLFDRFRDPSTQSLPEWETNIVRDIVDLQELQVGQQFLFQGTKELQSQKGRNKLMEQIVAGEYSLFTSIKKAAEKRGVTIKQDDECKNMPAPKNPNLWEWVSG